MNGGHRHQRVLVHREVVIHVELGLAHDAAEFREEPAQHASLVHQRQHATRMVLAADDVQEHLARRLIRARLPRNGPQRAPRRRHRLGMDIQLPFIRKPEQPHQLAGVLNEHLRICDGESSTINREAVFLDGFLRQRQG